MTRRRPISSWPTTARRRRLPPLRDLEFHPPGARDAASPALLAAGELAGPRAVGGEFPRREARERSARPTGVGRRGAGVAGGLGGRRLGGPRDPRDRLPRLRLDVGMRFRDVPAGIPAAERERWAAAGARLAPAGSSCPPRTASACLATSGSAPTASSLPGRRSSRRRLEAPAGPFRPRHALPYTADIMKPRSGPRPARVAPRNITTSRRASGRSSSSSSASSSPRPARSRRSPRVEGASRGRRRRCARP